MARYIDADALMQKLSRMIDYCEKNKDKKFNALNVLFQVGDALMDVPTANVAPIADTVRKMQERVKLKMDKHTLDERFARIFKADIDQIAKEMLEVEK